MPSKVRPFFLKIFVLFALAYQYHIGEVYIHTCLFWPFCISALGYLALEKGCSALAYYNSMLNLNFPPVKRMDLSIENKEKIYKS